MTTYNGMKVICLKENLKIGLGLVERISSKNLNLPILNNVLIETNEGFLSLTTTDLEIGVSVKIPAKIEKEGTVCVPIKIFSSYISNLPEEKIEIELKETTLSVKSEKYKASIKCQNAQDFPIVPKIKEGQGLLLEGIPIIKGFSQVVGACSFSNLRPEYSGVFFNLKNKNLKLAATDSFRLAQKTIESKEEGEKSFIIPQRTVLEAIRIFNENELLEIKNNKNQIVFNNNKSTSQKIKITLTSRLIDGEFPNYEVIIPKTSENEAIINKEGFLNQIKSASFFASRINDVKILLDYKLQETEVSSQDFEFGETKSRLQTEIKKDKEIEATFNYKFVLDGVNNITDDTIILGLNGQAGPAVLKPKNEKDYLYILMPIKST